jgi:hypothetical protein
VEHLDRILGVAELVLVPLSLGLLLAAAGQARSRPPLWVVIVGLLALTALIGDAWALLVIVPVALLIVLIARLSDRWPATRVAALPLTLITALTVAQPLGVKAERVDHPPVADLHGAPAYDPARTESVDVLGAPLLHFRLYRRKTHDLVAGLGECCPATHLLRIRSWVPPGLLTNGTEVDEICGDGPCWDPNVRVERNNLKLIWIDGSWYATLRSRGQSVAWRLSAGLTSRSGLAYWLVAGVGIFGLIWRRRAGEPGARPA